MNLLNAGVMAPPKSKTRDGFEQQIGVNHLAHFLLFELLKPQLLASSTPDFQSRVVALSSGAHRRDTVHLDDLHFENRDYEPWEGYGQVDCPPEYPLLGHSRYLYVIRGNSCEQLLKKCLPSNVSRL